MQESMNNKIWSSRAVFIVCSLLMGIFIYFFYFQYVPFVKSFQLVLMPVLFLVFFLTLWNIEYGILFFVFAFPLINSLPYFFGIDEHIPHAPTALVLFMFFFLGWLVHKAVKGFQRGEGVGSARNFCSGFHCPVAVPLILFSMLVVVSGVITAERYMNFYPFLSGAVYEWNTNVAGVSAGGAVMSTLFQALNYLTGITFFGILVAVASVRSWDFIRKMVLVVMAGFFVSLALGYYQGFVDLSFGSTGFWEGMGQFNSTFKDPNAFATYLVVVFPLILSMVFVIKGWKKIIPGLVLAGSLFLYPHIGNRSSLLGFLLGMGVFGGLVLWRWLKSRKVKWDGLKKALVLGSVVVFLGGCLGAFFWLKDSRLFQRVQIVQDVIKTRGSLISVSPERYFLWKEAVHMASLYPVTGVGVGAYIIELPNYYSLDKKKHENQLEQFRRIDSAENYFLHVWAEMGGVGLILSLWIFGAVVVGLIKVGRESKRSSFRDKSSFRGNSGASFLMAGLAAAGAAYIPNILFHSYIGSFEVKYVFWMVMAGVFSLGKWGKWKGKDGDDGVVGADGDEEVRKEQSDFWNKQGLRSLKGFLGFKCLIGAGMGLVVLWGAVHLWNSTHSLSLSHRMEKFDIQQNFGFYEEEKTPDGRVFHWTKKISGRTIRIDEPVLSITLHASHPDIYENPVLVKLFLVEGFFKEKKLLGELTLRSKEWKQFEFRVSEEVGREKILLIEVSRTWSPWKEIGTPDPRELGVAVAISSQRAP